MNRRVAVLAGVTLVAAGGTGAWRLLARPAAVAAPDPASAAVTTAPVARANLTAREQVPGSLGFAGDWRIEHPGPAGVLTSTPAPGSVVRRGEQLYEVDGQPVFLFYGTRPVWREFAAGMPRGEDIRQLESNLAALGFGPSTADNSFTAATATAIRRWQASAGLPRTGRIPLGGIVFVPDTVRVVEAATGRVGGPVLRGSSTRRVVTIDLPTARQGQVSPGSPVEVTLPGGQRTQGTVEDISRVAASGGEGENRQPTIAVTVTLGQPELAGTLDRAPVQVAITTATRNGVLAVPVTALRASATPGGYELRVVDGTGRRPLAVRPGLLDERAGLIEVTGDGLSEGLRVEVPAR